MIVTGCLGDESLTTLGVMDTLNGAEFFQFFKGTIDGDEAEAGAIGASEVVNVRRAEGTVAGGDGFNDGAAGGGEAVAVTLEEGEPGLDAVCCWRRGLCFHLLSQVFDGDGSGEEGAFP